MTNKIIVWSTHAWAKSQFKAASRLPIFYLGLEVDLVSSIFNGTAPKFSFSGHFPTTGLKSRALNALL
jgi:hypothetical protein